MCFLQGVIADDHWNDTNTKQTGRVVLAVGRHPVVHRPGQRARRGPLGDALDDEADGGIQHSPLDAVCVHVGYPCRRVVSPFPLGGTQGVGVGSHPERVDLGGVAFDGVQGAVEGRGELAPQLVERFADMTVTVDDPGGAPTHQAMVAVGAGAPSTGAAWAPRTSRPGRAPVGSPSRHTTSPATSVAT